MTNSAASHLLPVFARVDLGFERGEGAWLIAPNGDRCLDFTSGVAVNALGHAHPHLVKPLQGEGGVRSAPHAFFKALRQLCDDKGLLLIFDEVQTGMGRTGDLFAYKRIGVVPDVMPLAKALGGGFPIGACLATAEAAAGMTPGSQWSTFGGNPLAVVAANAVLDVMLEPGFFDHVL